ELLTGRPPFQAADTLGLLRLLQEADPAPPRRLAPGVDRDLETVCLKCLRKEPQQRYASALALADDLRRFLDGRPVLARRAPAWGRAVRWVRRRPVIAALVALVVALAAVGAGLAVWGALQKGRGERGEASAESARRRAGREELFKRTVQYARVLED